MSSPSDAALPAIARESRTLYRLGGIAAFLQLLSLIAYSIVLGVLGAKPETAAEFFAVYADSPIAAALRGDILLLVLICLYLFTFPAIYASLRRESPVWSAVATLLTIVAVVGAVASESTLSLLRLGEQYMGATAEVVRAQIESAARAVIATDMWNGTAAYVGGILLQGSGVIMSVVMLRSLRFRKLTAIAGIAGNGLDLIQHVLHLSLPGVSSAIAAIMGIPYLVWYVLLGLDLLRLARTPATADRGSS